MRGPHNLQKYRRMLRGEARHWSHGDPVQTGWFQDPPGRVARYENELLTGDQYKPWFRLIEDSGPFRHACSLGSGVSLIERELIGRGAVNAWDLYDLSSRALRRAKWSMGRHWRRVRTCVVDVNRVTLPPKTYDLILCNGCLHHFVQLERILDEISKALTDGGLLAVWDFVGETRLQWSEARIVFQQKLLDRVPREFRASPDARVLPPDVSTLSPFEAVRSEEIPALLQERFRPEFWKTLCGALCPLGLYLRAGDLERARPDILDEIVRKDRELAENPSPDFVNPVLCALLRRR
jgi:SAM-dependent methyltransferase